MRRSWTASAILRGSGSLLLCFGQDNRAELDAHVQKARDSIAHHDLRTASAEYGEALKLDPGNAEISAARGVSLYGLGEPAEAIGPLKLALTVDPTRSDAEIFLGLSLADLGQCREALPLLRRRFAGQLDLKLKQLVRLSFLGCCAANFSSTDEAVDIARQLKHSYPGDPDVLYQIAELCSQLSIDTVKIF